MKFLRTVGDKFELALNAGESGALLHLLRLYPLVPESHHRLTRDDGLPQREENQRLLDDALRAQREQNQKQIFALVNEPGRFTETDGTSKLAFTRSELEWLLQVINDVRVGSWLAIGSPDSAAEKRLRLNQKSVQRLVAMEMAGAFQMFFLAVISGGVRPDDAD